MSDGCCDRRRALDIDSLCLSAARPFRGRSPRAAVHPWHLTHGSVYWLLFVFQVDWCCIAFSYLQHVIPPIGLLEGCDCRASGPEPPVGARLAGYHLSSIRLTAPSISVVRASFAVGLGPYMRISTVIEWHRLTWTFSACPAGVTSVACYGLHSMLCLGLQDAHTSRRRALNRSETCRR